MYPLAYVLITIMFKEPTPVNQHLLEQARGLAQQCGATLQRDTDPAPAPVTYLTAFDDDGAFVAYKIDKPGILPGTLLIKSASEPYKSWMLCSTFMLNLNKGQGNWGKVKFSLYAGNMTQPSLTSMYDLSDSRSHNYMNGINVVQEFNVQYSEMMQSLSCLSNSAPDRRSA